MNPERFRQIRELFSAALDQKQEARDDFLQQVCAGDEALRKELASLLAEHDKKDSFLEPSAKPSAEPSAREVESQPLMEGRSIGPYRIEREIGRGGMGVVYLAEDTRLHRQVALKALHPTLVANPKLKERLQLEARAAASLSHPSIATVYALEELEGDLHLVTEYVPGKNLRVYLKEGPLPLATLLEVAVGIAGGLAAAHAKGIVHRDLKPENIVRNEQGKIKILDFGLAQMSEAEPSAERLTEAGTILGTPSYMAPEQLQGKNADFRSDIFTFGVLLYELACGSNPFNSKTPISTIAKILETEAEPVPDLQQQAPELDQIIQKCLRKNPEERYPSAQELLADLQQLAREVTSVPAREKAAGRAPRGKKTEETLLTLWWVIHQTSVLVLYGLMVVVGWKIKEWTPGIWNLLLFFGILGCAALNGTLRTHLLFTARFNRKEMNQQMRRSAPWIRRGDWSFFVLLLASAFVVAVDQHAFAGLLAGIAIGYLVVFLVVEPATARAAFSSRRRSRK